MTMTTTTTPTPTPNAKGCADGHADAATSRVRQLCKGDVQRHIASHLCVLSGRLAGRPAIAQSDAASADVAVVMNTRYSDAER